MKTDEFYMDLALELAKKGRGWVNPNPMVGAVIVKNGKIIGEGYHEKFGGLHAERNALQNCTEAAGGATLYVTLEPCCHYGKTPPCTEAIIENRISRVVIGSKDPNPLVAGKGIGILREHGIIVETGVLEAQCDNLNEVFFHYIKTKTPFVVMKYAMSADGKIAAYTGDSKWISSNAARNQVQETRASLSGIMVGIQTILADDPLLTCRLEGSKNPTRIICDSNLRFTLTSNIAKTAKDVPTIVATVSKDRKRAEELECLGITVISVGEKNGRVDLRDLMRCLGERGIDSVLLEGGSSLNFSALESGIVNRLQVYLAPKIIGGETAKTPVGGQGVARVSDAFPLKLKTMQTVGDDVLLEYDWEMEPCLQD